MAAVRSSIRALLSTAYDAGNYLSFSRHGSSHRFKGVYASYAAAQAALPAGAFHGFDHASVAEYFVDTHMVFNPSDYPVVFWLSKLMKSGDLLFDFGGGVGQSFYLYQRFLPFPERTHWLVCEVEALARRGGQLAEENHAPNLEFTTSFSQACGAAVLMTTGVLQYVEAELPSLLASLSKLPEHVLVNRVPMYSGKTYYTVQHSLHSFAPYKVSNLESFVVNMEELGYEKVDQWYLSRSLKIPFHPAQSVPFYHGFYFRLREPLASASAASH
ncbi:putative methyltransferase (TIGR04325 family) [Silvibacterium bohemicum]|uniref:Putative methyltransferase (TIGR04325 family) n=1 Tax=Silvibacterium bohemicum TaxID=1577686 RepID=A0A841JY81_9BACT|nr:methyltransferase, TIGR04325 family [Silvibacterium bohemicum]MBB6142934.1 putative methyltransferase (TIGR04325 family) [Silvibacterium bohemicum]